MVDINTAITRLVHYGTARGLCAEADRIYVINRILRLVHLRTYNASDTAFDIPAHPQAILDEIVNYMANTGILASDTAETREVAGAELMDALMPRPSEVVSKFYSHFNAWRFRDATDWYYNFSKSSHYIRTDRTCMDISWKSPSKYGELDISINLSKPEKDPRDIAAAKSLPPSDYPKCALCPQTEGYAGGGGAAARANHRIVPITLHNEDWFLQYSPYVYYDEHCIVLKKEHSPMEINDLTFARLLEFTGKLPHYFVGANADLPIVGGSILSHDHFQGGSYELPMARAKPRKSFNFAGFADIAAELLNWPMPVIRLRGEPGRLSVLASRILSAWRGYDDAQAEIFSFTDAPHNTVTPVARRRGGLYELDIVLRNNRTSDEHPLGIFHPHAELHHIKKENIGLIEVMGLAILPGRLKSEFDALISGLANNLPVSEIQKDDALTKHAVWYTSLLEKTKAGIPPEKAVRDGAGEKFARVLEDAGVFKNDPNGHAALDRFINYVNLF